MLLSLPMNRRLIHNLDAKTLQRRHLRANLTPAEATRWKYIKKSQLDGRKFRRQHSIGPYIADFYCPECRLIVELDGAGHNSPLAIEADEQRTEFLARFKVKVIRFENKEVFENIEWVLEEIRRNF